MVNKSSPTNTDRIYLTGFMGSGKSLVGRILAKRLGRPFADLDDVIVQEAGMSIPEIFRLRGEGVFREMEADAAARFTREQWVVALGGGTLVNPVTRDMLINSGTVVYLRTSPGTLTARLEEQRVGRPLLAGVEPLEEKVSSLLDDRSGIYSCAQWALDTDDLTAEQVAERIYERIRGKHR
jgi:shikimate kinase